MRSAARVLLLAAAVGASKIPSNTDQLWLEENEILPQVMDKCKTRPSFLSFGPSANRFEFAHDHIFELDVGSARKVYKGITRSPADRLFWARLGAGDDYKHEKGRNEFKIEDERQMHLVGNLITDETGDCTTFTMVMTDNGWEDGVEMKVDGAYLFRVGEDEDGKPVARTTLAAFNCRLNVRDGAVEAAACQRLRQCIIDTIWDDLDHRAILRELQDE